MYHYQIYIDRLRDGEVIVLEHGGSSMMPIIKPHEPRTIMPCHPDVIEPGDIVYCKWRNYHFTHLVKAIKGKGGKKKFLIANNHGGINGWININNLYGVVVKVGDRVIKNLVPLT
jgi:hypothetical protein